MTIILLLFISPQLKQKMFATAERMKQWPHIWQRKEMYNENEETFEEQGIQFLAQKMN